MPTQTRKLKFAHPSGSQPLAGYTIKRGIGIGGFGEVYFALSDAGKEVALKRIQRNLDIELRGVRQCLNLKHINLIRLWDICTSDHGESWVVMEYVPGESLGHVLDRHPSGLPEAEVKKWFLSTASGVSYLHSRGIVHRDLKPGNIFFDDDEQIVKIGDYGLSKFISCSRRSGQTESVGTFHYMAPEIGNGVYGKEIDIYALGIILYEMLTGQVPFDGESTQEIIMKHLTASPDVSKLAEPYASIVAKAMQKDAQARYRQVADMIADFPGGDQLVSRIGPVETGATVELIDESAQPSLDTTTRYASPMELDHSNEHPPPEVTQSTSSTEPLVIADDIVFGVVEDVVQAESVVGFPSDVSTHPSGIDPPNSLPSHRSRASRDTVVQPVPSASPPSSTSLSESEPVANINAASAPAIVPDEPIAAAVGGTWARFLSWWNSGSLNTPLKCLLVVLGALVLLRHSSWLLPASFALGVLYLIYWTIRKLVLVPRPISTPLPLHAPAAASESANINGQKKSIDQTMSQLLGAMILATLIGLTLGMLAYAVATFNREPNSELTAMFTMGTAVSIVASWAMLIAAQIFQTRRPDRWHRRLALLGSGVMLGLMSVGLARLLELPGHLMLRADSRLPVVEDHLHFTDGRVWWAGIVISFAAIFSVLRWWRQANPIRRTRLSTISLSITMVWATVVGSVFGVNILWLALVAGATSILVQLSSTWIHPSDRAVV